MLRKLFVLGLCGAWLGLAGCGGGGDTVKTVEVTGEVKVGGKTLEGVEVHFIHAKFSGVGKTDATGKYKLQAAPGDNKVWFSKVEGAGAADTGMDAGQAMAAASGTADPAADPNAIVAKGEVIPDKYTRFATTDKSAAVKDAGPNNFDFDLQ